MQPSTALPGDRIGKYTILAHVATGGMGSVYRARDEDLGRVVALKILTPELSGNPILVERFKREARAAARLHHKNIVTLYECGQTEGLYYLAMEFIRGIDLSEYIRRKGQLDPEEARRILIQACKALEHAAEHGITHRDVKPSNFLLANDEGRCRVKLTDLGLSHIDSEEDFRVTRAGTTVGTVDYMAPEQARDSADADVRSDVYSLGCTFYHMLAGHPPFPDGGLGERIYKHQSVDPPDVRDFNEDVPAGLWTVLRRMLAKDPEDRFQTPGEIIEALRTLSDVPSLDQLETEAPQDEPSDEPMVPEIPLSPVSLPVAPSRQGPPTKRRPSTLNEMNTVSDDPPDALDVTPEMRQAALGQFLHAAEVMRSGGDLAYAQELLLSCCKLDPVNLKYRKTLREVNRDLAAKRKGGWFGSLTLLPVRGRLKKARHAGEHRQALEHGEELLCRAPNDIPAQIEMAQSAEELGLTGLATWMLEEARAQDPTSVAVLRELADLYGHQKRYSRAIALWEKVRELAPDDADAIAKIRELSVNDTLERGNYRRLRDEANEGR
jgi:serine/threonine protein kinase